MVAKHLWMVSAALGISAVYTLLFFLGVIGIVGDFLLAMFLLFILIAVIALRSDPKGKYQKVSPWKFLALMMILFAVILSSGIIYDRIPSGAALSPSGAYSVAFFLPVVFLVIIIFMALESSGLLKSSIIPSGYEEFEVDNEIYLFNRSVITIGALATGVSMGFMLLVVSGPTVDIGLIPAIAVFIVVYFIVIYTILKKESS